MSTDAHSRCLELAEALAEGDGGRATALARRLSASWFRRGLAGEVLQEAAKDHRMQVLDLLLKCGLGVDTPDPHGVSALERAAHVGDLELVVALLQRGAAPCRAERRRGAASALHTATVKGYTRIVECMLEAGADISEIVEDPRVCLFRVPGDTLRLLQRRGGRLPDEIERMLEAGGAIGDPRPTERPVSSRSAKPRIGLEDEPHPPAPPGLRRGR